jgi:membrane-bound ClpP family serine protease
MVGIILLVLAVACFLLEALTVKVGTLNLIAWGLALFAAAHLWGGYETWRGART